MQLAPTAQTANGARYGGYLSIKLPTDHPAWAPGYEGDYQWDPRFVVTDPAIRRNFASLDDAIAAAQRYSAGARDAVAVVRDPGAGDDGPWHVDHMLVKGLDQDRYAGIDLEGVALRGPKDGVLDVWQPLQSQRQVIVGAIVDGELAYRNVARYQSSRPDLPGRDPDGARG